MRYYRTRPNGYTTFMLTFLAIMSVAQGIRVARNGGDPTLWFAFFTVAGGVGFVLSVLYIVDCVLDLRERNRDINTRTARLRELEAASKLTPEQATVVPVVGMDPEVDAALDGNMLFTYYLMTPEGRIPLEWVREFVLDSGIIYLRAINTYSEGTVGYNYAVWLTNWFVNKGFAFPHNGPHPAQWKTEQTKALVAKLFGVEWEMPNLGMGDFRSVDVSQGE